MRFLRCPGGQVLALVVGLAPGREWANSSPSLYAADPVRAGGGGGRVFTGAPRDGLDCSVCHRGGAAPTLELKGGPGEVYVPGATYQFELNWAAGQHVGLAAEAADPSGAPLGALRVASGKDLLIEERCAGGKPTLEIVLTGRKKPERKLGDGDRVIVITNEFLATQGDDFGHAERIEIDEEGPPFREPMAALLEKRGGVLRPEEWFLPGKPRIARRPADAGDCPSAP